MRIMQGRLFRRRTWCAFASAAFAASAAHAQTPAIQPAGPSFTIKMYGLQDQVGLVSDPSTRLTLPVVIGGAGPFPFAIDTGSQRTIIATELAQKLGLRALAPVEMVRIAEKDSVPSVHADRLSFGMQTLSGPQLLSLSRKEIGNDGLIGLDGLSDKRLILDFRTGQIAVQFSKGSDTGNFDNMTMVARAQNQHGQLVIGGSLDDQPVSVVINTGADVTLGNMALYNRLAQQGLISAPESVVLDTGGGRPVSAQYAVSRRLQIGLAKLNNVPIYFFDAAPFAQWDLGDKPALLLGMTMLRKFDEVAIDFGGRHVDFRVP